MLNGWTDDLSSTVDRLRVAYTTGAEENPYGIAAARKTEGLPVYCDIGGCLAITRDGRILEYAAYDESVTEVTDPEWISRALDAAAAKFPELRPLKFMTG
jgi:hypothetical protein